jgi:hypothetical protein
VYIVDIKQGDRTMTYTNRYEDTLTILGTEQQTYFDRTFTVLKCKVVRNEGIIADYFDYLLNDLEASWDPMWLMSAQVNAITDHIDLLVGMKLY